MVEFNSFKNVNQSCNGLSFLKTIVAIWGLRKQENICGLKDSFFELFVSFMWIYLVYAIAVFPFDRYI